MEKNPQQPPSPYVFILEEGKSIQGDPMDYSLMLLQTNCPEKLSSPLSPSAREMKEVPLYVKMGTSIRSTPQEAPAKEELAKSAR